MHVVQATPKKSRGTSTEPTGDGGEEAGFWRVVKIDKRKWRVNYGSEEVYCDLIREWSNEAHTDIVRAKNPSRKWFKCVHCGYSKFSGKVRLNRHRWCRECPAVKDQNGKPQQLLPYPDQGSGQGKSSEMIRKGKEARVMERAVGRTSPKPATAKSGKTKTDSRKDRGEDNTPGRVQVPPTKTRSARTVVDVVMTSGRTPTTSIGTQQPQNTNTVSHEAGDAVQTVSESAGTAASSPRCRGGGVTVVAPARGGDSN